MKKIIDFFVDSAEWITVIGGIFALVGSILLNVKSKRDGDKNEQKQSELLKQSIKINRMMTGGDSYPLAYFYDIDHDFGVAQYAISNKGDFPLYVSQMQISDNYEINRVSSDSHSMTSRGIDEALLEPFRRIVQLQEIVPKHSFIMNTFPFQFKDGGSFTIAFTARNGTFLPVIVTCKFRRKWLLAERVSKFGDNEVLYKVVPEGFPTDKLK